MHTLLRLTSANLKSFTRDRAAMFWTLAFPLVFILLFGAIFSGGTSRFTVAWVDGDGSPSSTALLSNPALANVFTLKTYATADDAIAAMKQGDVRAVLVIPKGFGSAIASAGAVGGAALPLTVYTDPSNQQVSGTITGIVASLVGGFNQARDDPGDGPGDLLVRRVRVDRERQRRAADRARGRDGRTEALRDDEHGADVALLHRRDRVIGGRVGLEREHVGQRRVRQQRRGGWRSVTVHPGDGEPRRPAREDRAAQEDEDKREGERTEHRRAIAGEALEIRRGQADEGVHRSDPQSRMAWPVRARNTSSSDGLRMPRPLGSTPSASAAPRSAPIVPATSRV